MSLRWSTKPSERRLRYFWDAERRTPAPTARGSLIGGRGRGFFLISNSSAESDNGDEGYTHQALAFELIRLNYFYIPAIMHVERKKLVLIKT